MSRTAARVMAETLAAHGVDRVFCVAGESYLPLLDTFYDMPDIDVVTCRHEGSAAFMALADAKLTGHAGVCLASRGPGAANSVIGVHAAAEDGSPLILLVGGVATDEAGRETFQDVDCATLFSGVAKAAWTVGTPDAAGEFLARAFRLAESGTPGPVVLMLPEDILPAPTLATAIPRPSQAATYDGLQHAGPLIDAARRPLILAGSEVDSPHGRELLREVAERHHIPVATSNKNQHLLPNRHPCYAGHLHNSTSSRQMQALGEADLVVAVGTRLDEITTRGHSYPPSATPLVHVYPDAARLGTFHETACGIAADPVGFLEQLAARRRSNHDPSWAETLHRIETEQACWQGISADDGIVFGAVVACLDELTGGDVTAVVDSGTFTSWVYRHLRFGPRGRLLGISSSAMGFSVGAAVAAAMRRTPQSPPVVAFVGDGGFLMNSGELITACQRRLAMLFVIANNNSYATIRRHQERTYPGRVIATDLSNPDFAGMAESFGALGLRVDTPEQIRPCLSKALECGGPAVVEVRTSLRVSRADT
ncbi:thiamine pyrophosphate-binding protein [Allorhizocola rhizosphaerae]|uniref:thiamine pyrophosphate-binding protein n=1 Tax=Allorhizocola rhizosphaerae TaxID=1872709 RepID=UPI000E3C90FB|nr:thiamine pyrophosphate-dependent enzyme [Allorhizocola rhizosphaerae]